MNTLSTIKLTGSKALEFARLQTAGVLLNSFQSPNEDEVLGLCISDAEEIAKEDVGLLWVEVSHETVDDETYALARRCS